MSMPASVLSSSSPSTLSPVASKPQPLVAQKQCHGCSKQIHQAKVFIEPGRPSVIYCEKCYIEKFSKGNCPACYKPVLTKSDPYVTHNRRSWHTACFACFKCRVNLSSKPMVDLRGRPCCEDCLMAQAGAEQSPVQESERTFGDSLTPADRSLSNSPAPSPLRYPTSLKASTNDIDDTIGLTKRLQLSTSPQDLNTDFNLGQTNSPLSAQSYSSQSSFGAPSKANASSGYTSGTSSTHSSLGRNKRPDQGPSSTVLPTSTANLLKSEQSLSAGGPLFSYQRPGSALSIHSYTSSRPASPASSSQHGQDHIHDSTDDLDSTLRDKGSRTNGTEWNNLSDATLNALRRSRSRSFGNIEGFSSSVTRPQVNGGTKYEPVSQSNSRPGTPSTKHTTLDVYPASVKVDPIVLESQPKQLFQQTQQPSRPPIGRSRSRSTVAPSSVGGVRARTEAWMNQAQSTTSPSAKTSNQQLNSLGLSGRTNGFGNDNRSVSSFNASLKQSSADLSEKDVKDPKSTVTPLEVEPNRPSLSRHGRQRSNTVGEAISFPSVKVDSPLTSPSQQRAVSIPEGHCHKCYERVTENGIRLQNGDRYHISCFLCNGCKQVFTESEFHIVFGRPYHPGKVLLSTSKFFEVDGRVECDLCCEERDRVRLAPKIVPVPRATDHFPTAPSMVASGPGLMATTTASNAAGLSHEALSRSESMYGPSMSANASGTSSPQRSPGSPAFSYSSSANLLSDSRDQLDGEYGGAAGMSSPVLVMASPSAVRSTPPALTSLFSTRTRPLPKFGGVTTCPRCQQAVGVMDQVPGPKNEKWHKKCLNCKECKKVLDSSALTRGEGEAFCRGCFVSP
ncbi:Four and a half LIM domains protein 5 [Linnemannia zychae]|nr:Four and a half LIM domains protein 5 [Linnemannia zychae]